MPSLAKSRSKISKQKKAVKTLLAKTSLKNGHKNGVRIAAKTVSKKATPGAGKSPKRVYFFGGTKAEGNKEMKNLLGGKGANLAEMANIGLPVPPGFTITTEVCTEFYDNGKKLPKGLDADM